MGWDLGHERIYHSAYGVTEDTEEDGPRECKTETVKVKTTEKGGTEEVHRGRT